jgi:hypothetical protein
VHRESACALEPALVAGALERSQERVAVAGRAVADRRALLVSVRACLPDELGAREQQVLASHRRTAWSEMSTRFSTAASCSLRLSSP